MDIKTSISSNSKTTRLPYIDNIKGFGMILEEFNSSCFIFKCSISDYSVFTYRV